MQLIVLGMHRSGTSVTARLLNMMGAYFTEEGNEMPCHKDNPKGYWERMDVMALNERLLGHLKTSWNQVSRFHPAKISGGMKDEFRSSAATIIHRLDAHRPWMLKDPRLCLTFALWRPLLELPICVFTYRSPLQVARSLRTRDGIPLPAGIALWERYLVGALQATQGLPKILVLHEELMKEPEAAVKRLYHALVQHDVQGLRIPHAKEIKAFLDEKLYHQRDETVNEPCYLNASQIRLNEIFKLRQIEKMDEKYECSLGAVETLRRYELELLIRQRLRNRKNKLETGRLILIEKNNALTEQNGALATRNGILESEKAALKSENTALKSENTALKSENAALKSENAAQASEKTALMKENAMLTSEKTSLADEMTDWRRSVAGRVVQPLRMLELAAKRILGRPQKYLRKELKLFYYSIPLFTPEQKKKFADHLRGLKRKINYTGAAVGPDQETH